MLKKAQAMRLLCALAVVAPLATSQTVSRSALTVSIEHSNDQPLGQVELQYSTQGYGPFLLDYESTGTAPAEVRLPGPRGSHYDFELTTDFGHRATSLRVPAEATGVRIIVDHQGASSIPLFAERPSRKISRPGRESLGGTPIDECTGAIEIPFGQMSSFDNGIGLGANPSDPIFSCSGTQGFRTAWFLVTPTVSSIFLEADADYPVLMALYEGPCGSLVELACIAGVAGQPARLEASGLVPGTTYTIQMATADDSMTGLTDVSSGSNLPSNDECVNATVMTCDSTITANNDTATQSATDPGLSCLTGAPASATVWYSFEATSTQVTIETTAGTNPPIAVDTVVALFFGTCPAPDPSLFSTRAGGGLFELGCNDDNGIDQYSSLTVDNLLVGTTYLIQVGSVLLSQTGEFELSVTCTDPPANDNPADANTLFVPGGIVGSTVGATSDLDGFPCDVPSGPFDNVWYRVQGTGSLMTATTCSVLTDFDTRISVFCEGGPMLCVAGNDDNCTGPGPANASTVSWCSQADATYLITVGGPGNEVEGQFRLDLQTEAEPCDPVIFCVMPPMPPPNDDPQNAITLANPTSILVDTEGATNDIAVPCGVPAGPFNNVWYRVQGTGGTMNITTCSNDTQIDTRISVFCDDLVNFPCVAGNDDNCTGGPATASSVSWCSQASATYLVSVGSAMDGVTGDIRVSFIADSVACTPTVICEDPPMAPPNDNPENAAPLAVGATVIADTTTATSDIGVPCGVDAGPFNNVWYRVRGNGRPIVASTCDSPVGFVNTRISVFCDDPTLPCIAGNDDNPVCARGVGAEALSMVTWCSQEGVDYLVTIGGSFEGDTGMISLMTSTIDDPCIPDPPCVDGPQPGDICFMIDHFRAVDDEHLRLRAAFFAGENFDPTQESFTARIIDVVDGSVLSFTVPVGGFVIDDPNEFEYRNGPIRVEIDLDDRDIEVEVDDLDIDSIDGNELTFEFEFSITGIVRQTIIAIREEDDDEDDDDDDDDDDDAGGDDDDDDLVLRFDAPVAPDCFDLPQSLISPPELDVDFEDVAAGDVFSISVVGGTPGDLVSLFLVEANGVPTAWPAGTGVLDPQSEFLLEAKIPEGLALVGGEYVYRAVVTGEDGEIEISDPEVLRVHPRL